MIQKLQLQNFQSHKDSTLEFTPGVNTIIGPSDSGKTAIIRALKWAIWNRPLGNSFVSHWAEDAAVRITTNEAEIERYKGKKDHYKIKTASGDVDFHAFGTDVPDEIQEILNFSDINLQSQMDNSFLIANNSGEVSRHFNKIANIEKIDTSLKAVERWVRSIAQDIKYSEEQADEYRKELQEFEYLDRLEADIEGLEHMDEKRVSMRNKYQKLSSLLTEITELEKEIENNSSILPLEPAVDSILDLIAQRETVYNRLKTLLSLSKNIYNTHKELKEYKALTKIDSAVESILSLYSDRKQIQKKLHSLEKSLDQLQQIKEKYTKTVGRLGDLQETWYEEMPDVCPLCESNIK